ncbi:DNA-binding protein (histone) [Bordetella pertussis]|uniref:DNA-binding protein (Histone) n=4 Tax=Bordetella pertussis TaxID=520 RepID=Q79GJ5_BORPE|nr:H-NS histone family protein [Bordetella pertussis]ETH40064.1 H-NS histone family protein [Bordetella pertussis H918]ETH43398.1 H-NS histone family protein [Bordetella pertussis H939]ETH47420.1 H-NS histone family protein [Bordetella pertussis H921]ETH72101.1 H-NS histone family protein [Bordetella pertussis STO1-CHLA-0011]ETH83352.1 H-NS histone family protein [Bordetella pertussis STO1-CHOC-0017]ETH87178.1 H-NS histone family protein [Bordetella pertussis STO1-CHOC-0018]ETH91524.1 H-NS h
MPRENYAVLQAKIEKEITKLKHKAEALHTRRRKPVIASIVKSMREYNITPEEIAAAFGSAKSVRAPSAPVRRKAGAPVAKRAVAPKYRHPQTGETWSGRGKAPRWLAAEEAAGAKRDSFLIRD